MNNDYTAPTGDAPEESRGLSAARSLAFVLMFLVGVFSFILSFTALRDLAVRAHILYELSWMLAAVIDGPIVVATLGVVVLGPYPHRRRDRRYLWSLLFAFAAISIGLNMAHAFLPTDGPLPVWLRAFIAAIPPCSLLVTTHGLVILGRRPNVAADTKSFAHQPHTVPDASGMESSISRVMTVPVDHEHRPKRPQPVEAGERARWTDMAAAVIERAALNTQNSDMVAEALHLSYDRAWPQRQIGDHLKISHNTVGKILRTCAALLREGEVRVAEAS
ncbi:DUF2637 domain-containing protein [Mycolicibacterium goodii]|uniref:DUF2637 domain-containing protein n=1 Tax=Mycolicibacterium goodii TaxID=134601 RepID=UPI001BDC90B4|nr:DUF2637 domain-containing protein [Mycolicibacterium goodii]MBU8819248.1 DUF2637 domain-containing protein [Mycolicibacterium goodii]